MSSYYVTLVYGKVSSNVARLLTMLNCNHVSLELSIKSLKKETKITDEQLDTRIEETDLPELAACFDNTDDYVEKLGLTPGQQTDVHDARTKAPSDGTKAGMKVALKYWRNKNPLLATFRSLLLIILPLLKGDVVLRVCNFVLSKCKF